jgi:tRNA nucleotidyltransferase/poly(A) polymerase
MKYELFEVGGAVRDSILGIDCKDIDYTVVITGAPSNDANMAFLWFNVILEQEGYQVFLATPEVFTIRAKFPKDHKHAGLVADFVLARKESGFIPNTRRPLNIELGTLEDDLLRRDFCINAIARDLNGNLIDPFDGKTDLIDGILRCPVSPEISFNDDPLRILRALRFSLTKDMWLDDTLILAIKDADVDRFIETVSIERIREELMKMFKFDTKESLKILSDLNNWNYRLYDYILDNIWLKPTTEAK